MDGKDEEKKMIKRRSRKDRQTQRERLKAGGEKRKRRIWPQVERDRGTERLLAGSFVLICYFNDAPVICPVHAIIFMQPIICLFVEWSGGLLYICGLFAVCRV